MLTFDVGTAVKILATLKEFVANRGLGITGDPRLRRRKTCIITITRMQYCSMVDGQLHKVVVARIVFANGIGNRYRKDIGSMWEIFGKCIRYIYIYIYTCRYIQNGRSRWPFCGFWHISCLYFLNMSHTFLIFFLYLFPILVSKTSLAKSPYGVLSGWQDFFSLKTRCQRCSFFRCDWWNG